MRQCGLQRFLRRSQQRLFLTALVTGLLGMVMPALVAAGDPHLQQLFEEDWESNLKEQPTFASHLGDKRYNDRWPDVSQAAIDRRHTARLRLLERLEALPQGQFTAADRLNFRLFRKNLEWEIEAHQYQGYLMPLDMRSGIQDEGSVADSLSFDTVKDYEDWLTRMRAFPAYMEQTIGLMREGIRTGIVQPRIVMQRLPAQIRRQIVSEPSESLFYKPFKAFNASIPAAEQTRLRTAAQEAVRGSIVPAFQKFETFFEKEYLPNCLDGIGAWRLPKGQEYYAFLARQFTTTTLTPREIHDIGLREVTRIRAEMEAIRRQVGFQGSLKEFFEHLRTAPEFYFEKPEDLLAANQAFCKRVDPLLTKVFKTLPRIPYGVEPIPDHIAPDTTAAYYRPPAADGSRAGTYFVNLYKPASRPKYEIAALSLHEAVPGHHLQIALATELTDVPTFRRFLGVTAFVEGWALYSESLGEELGLYSDPYSKFGQLTYEMWRAIRLVVDTGMHSLQWTRDDAIAFFRDNAAKSELDIVNEIDRYIGWPGQALAYKIGELKIKELRKRAEHELGGQFDLREFHDVVLLSGAIPLDVLAIHVETWIAERRSRAVRN